MQLYFFKSRQFNNQKRKIIYNANNNSLSERVPPTHPAYYNKITTVLVIVTGRLMLIVNADQGKF